MEHVQKRMEVERIANLIRAFGWEKVGEDIDDNYISLRIQKPIMPGLDSPHAVTKDG